MTFLLSTLIGEPSGLWKVLLRVFGLVSEGVLPPILLNVSEFVDAI